MKPLSTSPATFREADPVPGSACCNKVRLHNGPVEVRFALISGPLTPKSLSLDVYTCTTEMAGIVVHVCTSEKDGLYRWSLGAVSLRSMNPCFHHILWVYSSWVATLVMYDMIPVRLL